MQNSHTQDIVLNGVSFGDVWVCSGQSNMEFNLGGAFNGSEEVAKMAEYPNIKMFRVDHQVKKANFTDSYIFYKTA